MREVSFSNELTLVLACCRPPGQAGRLEAIASASRSHFDEDRLIDLTLRHRVTGHLQAGLQAIRLNFSDYAASRLSGADEVARMQTLRAAAEEVRLAGLLADKRIDAVFVKGATLAMRAYGNLDVKTSRDIDLLIALNDFSDVQALLERAGYCLQCPPGATTPRRLLRFVTGVKETQWIHLERGIQLELHTRLVDNARNVRLGMDAPRASIAVMPGRNVQTLADAPLLAYLAIHGATHHWERLKWLADFAALQSHLQDDLDEVKHAAKRLGAAAAVEAALNLSSQLLASPSVSPGSCSKSAARLIQRSLNAICHEAEPATDRTIGASIRFRQTQLTMASGVREWLGTLASIYMTPWAPRQLAVPRGLLFPFTALWLPLHLARRWSLSARTRRSRHRT